MTVWQIFDSKYCNPEQFHSERQHARLKVPVAVPRRQKKTRSTKSGLNLFPLRENRGDRCSMLRSTKLRQFIFGMSVITVAYSVPFPPGATVHAWCIWEKCFTIAKYAQTTSAELCRNGAQPAVCADSESGD
jgi:hypothetical protein